MSGTVSKFIAHMTIWIKLWCHSDYSYNQSIVEAINLQHPIVVVGYQVQVVASCEISLNRRFDEILPHHCHHVIGYSLTQGVHVHCASQPTKCTHTALDNCCCLMYYKSFSSEGCLTQRICSVSTFATQKRVIEKTLGEREEKERGENDAKMLICPHSILDVQFLDVYTWNLGVTAKQDKIEQAFPFHFVSNQKIGDCENKANSWLALLTR